MAKAAKEIGALVPNGRAAAIAERGERALARANTVADVRRVEKWLGKVRKIVAEATERHDEINKIGRVWIRAIRKGGRLLRETKASGERHSGRGHVKVVGSRRATPPSDPVLSDLGLNKHRSSRWQQVESLPDDVFEELEQQILLTTPDAVVTLEDFLAAAKHRQREKEKVAKVIPTTATIVRAACLDWLPKQPDCDLLLTDPPYSTEIDDIKAFAEEWLPMALKKVKRTGRAYVCVGAYEEELRAYLNIDTPAHLERPQVLVWAYENTIGATPKYDYKQNWQAILYYRGVDAPPIDCKTMVEQFSVQDISAPDGRHGTRWHTWQKPDELCERFVRHASKPKQLILDPFAGSGSFILAAAKLGRKAHGCDIDPKMVALAKKRGCKGR